MTPRKDTNRRNNKEKDEQIWPIKISRLSRQYKQINIKIMRKANLKYM